MVAVAAEFAVGGVMGLYLMLVLSLDLTVGLDTFVGTFVVLHY